MTLNIPLSPDKEAQLRARAAALGMDPKQFVLQTLEEELAESNGESSLSSDARIAAWDRFASGTRDWTRELPSGRRLDDSRETIYEGRGE